jgi:nucleotide-binding universal stress UspA family protein
MYSRILVPIDGSDQAHRGLEVACALADQFKAKLVLLCVAEEEIPEDLAAAAINEGIVRPASYDVFVSTLANPSIATAQAQAKREVVLSGIASAISNEVVARGASFAKEQQVAEVLTLVRSGAPDDRILEVAKDSSADLIVIGSRGREGLGALFDPSVAESVRKRAPCPCLVLFPGEHG